MIRKIEGPDDFKQATDRMLAEGSEMEKVLSSAQTLIKKLTQNFDEENKERARHLLKGQLEAAFEHVEREWGFKPEDLKESVWLLEINVGVKVPEGIALLLRKEVITRDQAKTFTEAFNKEWFESRTN